MPTYSEEISQKNREAWAHKRERAAVACYEIGMPSVPPKNSSDEQRVAYCVEALLHIVPVPYLLRDIADAWALVPQKALEYVSRADQEIMAIYGGDASQKRARRVGQLETLLQKCLALGDTKGATAASKQLTKVEGSEAPQKVEHSGGVLTSPMVSDAAQAIRERLAVLEKQRSK